MISISNQKLIQCTQCENRMEGGNGGRYPKEHPFRCVRYVSCMPVSKWKVSNHARVKLTLSLCCVASKGHGIESLGDDTITATAGKQQHCRCL